MVTKGDTRKPGETKHKGGRERKAAEHVCTQVSELRTVIGAANTRSRKFSGGETSTEDVFCIRACAETEFGLVFFLQIDFCVFFDNNRNFDGR